MRDFIAALSPPPILSLSFSLFILLSSIPIWRIHRSVPTQGNRFVLAGRMGYSRKTRARRRGSATSLVSALSFVNARRLLTYFHFTAPPPFATVTFVITKPIINRTFASSRNASVLNPSFVTRMYKIRVHVKMTHSFLFALATFFYLTCNQLLCSFLKQINYIIILIYLSALR